MKRSKFHIAIFLLIIFNSGYIQIAFANNHDSLNLYLANSLYFKADSLSDISNFKAADSLFKVAETLFLEEEENYLYTSCLIKHSKVMYGLGKVKNAEEYLKYAEDAFFKFDISQSDTLYSNYLNRKGYYYIIRGDNDKAKVAYLESTQIRKEKEAIDFSLSYAYNNLGFIYNVQGDLSNAKLYFTKSLEIRERVFGANDSRLAKTYSTYGAFLITLGQYEKAKEYLILSKNMYTIYYGENYVELGVIYNNLGIVSYNIRDYQTAENYYLQAIQILSSYPEKYLSYLSYAYNNLGLIHYETDNLEIALSWFTRNLNFLQDNLPAELDRAYIKIANTYKKLGSYDLAEDYYSLAIDHIVKFHDTHYPKLASAYLNFGLFYSENANYDTALKLYFKALDINTNHFGIKHPSTSRCFYNIAEVYKDLNLYDSALLYIQKSLIATVDDFDDVDIHKNPSININSFSNLRLLSSLKTKAEILLLEFYKHRENTDLLKLAFSTLEVAVGLIEKIRLEYISEESKLYLAKNEKETYDEIIETALYLYEQTNVYLYKEKAFVYSEKSKSAILLSTIRNIEAKEFGGIPLEMLQEESDVKHDLSVYKEYLFNEKQLDSPDLKKLQVYQNYIFSLSNRYDSIIREFEKGYPEYHALKFDTKTISSSEVAESLGRNEVLIEYNISDTSLIIFLITKDEFLVKRKNIDSNFEMNVYKLQNCITNSDFSRNMEEEYACMVSSSNSLYQQLIDPFRESLSKKHLIIIPDGVLAYLPFEILITEVPEYQGYEYHSLSYLIKSHPIHYSYSATLLLNDLVKRRSAGTKFLAFAPQYKSHKNTTKDQSYLRQPDVEELYPLPFSKEEVESILKVTRGKVMVDEKATETKFKEIASEFDILHLAMHTIIDNNTPMYSKLAFTRDNDSLNDGFLKINELYNLQLSAKLVVLSSCSSGSGKLQRGEGIMSIARGFMYAGSPSVVMTLWALEDKSGSIIMKKFYSYLKRGYPKSKALRKAKLDFLEEATLLKSHPYFWAPYINLGDNSAIYAGIWQGKIIPSLLVVSLILIWLRRKNYKKSI